MYYKCHRSMLNFNSFDVSWSFHIVEEYPFILVVYGWGSTPTTTLIVCLWNLANILIQNIPFSLVWLYRLCILESPFILFLGSCFKFNFAWCRPYFGVTYPNCRLIFTVFYPFKTLSFISLRSPCLGLLRHLILFL